MNFCPLGDSLQTSKVSVINDTTDCDVIYTLVKLSQGFPGDSVVKDLPANAGDAGLIPGLGRPLEKEMATHSNILALEIPWTQESGGL